MITSFLYGTTLLTKSLPASTLNTFSFLVTEMLPQEKANDANA